MNNKQPLFLNEEQVRQHLRMADLIPAMEKALIDFSAGKVTQPVRSVIKVDPPGGFLGLMPALNSRGTRLKGGDILSIQCGAWNPNAHGDDFSCRSGDRVRHSQSWMEG